MEEKELRELLRGRLYMELNLFKDSMLQKAKEEIYGASYQIEVFINVYEILLEDADGLGIDEVRTLLYWKHGILEALYQEWLGREDGILDELRAYVGGELQAMIHSGRGKVREDGTDISQAA